MGKMYTLKPDESINDHVKESISLLRRLTEIVKEAYKYLPEKDCTLETGVFLDIDSRAFYNVIEHACNSIEMLDELCDELEDDKDEIRHEYEEKVIQFFNSWMNSDMSYEYKCRAEEATKQIQKLNEDCVRFRELAISRDKELEQELEQERERSNQLEQQLAVLKNERDLAKKLAKKSAEEVHALKTDLTRSELELKAVREVLDKKYDEIESLTQQLIDTSPNNPQNFCGNCKHFVTHANDIGTCNNKWAKPFIVDPDDASCPHFEYHKPDQPCCKDCNRDDCDDCTLCPF